MGLVELGDVRAHRRVSTARIQLLGNGTPWHEHLAKIGHTTSAFISASIAWPSGFDLGYTMPRRRPAVRLRAEVILQPGHVLLPAARLSSRRGDAVEQRRRTGVSERQISRSRLSLASRRRGFLHEKNGLKASRIFCKLLTY